MKKQSSTAQSLYVQHKKKGKQKKRFPLFFFAFESRPLFTPSSSQLTDTASSIQSAHVPSAALFWTAAVVAARRILYSPTFLPALLSFKICFCLQGQVECVFIKLRMNSSALSSVWFLFPCSCVCFSSSVCVLCVFSCGSVCVAPSVCVWQGQWMYV